MDNLTHPDARGGAPQPRVLADGTPHRSPEWQATRTRLLAQLHQLELLSLQLRRLIGDPYGRPIRPDLRVVPNLTTSESTPEVES